MFSPRQNKTNHKKDSKFNARKIITLVLVCILLLVISTFILDIDLYNATQSTTSNFIEETPANLSPKLVCPPPKPKGEAKKTQSEYYDYFGKKLEFKGCVGIEKLLPALLSLFEIRQGWIFIDVGANVGSTTADFLNIFGNLQFRRYIKHYIHEDKGGVVACHLDEPQIYVYAFEPMPLNLRRLKSRFEKFDYWLENVTLVEEAVSDFGGQAQFYARGVEGYEEGSLGGAKHKAHWPTYNITVTTIDTYFNWNPIIFLLKIDAERHDPYVLFGAEQTLREKRAMFITFEWNPYFQKYDDKTIDLKYVIDWLWNLDYACFLITEKMLIPFFDEWFPKNLPKEPEWSNIFCGVLNQQLIYILEIFHIQDPLMRDFIKYHVETEINLEPIEATEEES